MDSLEEMNKFLQMYNLPRLYQEEMLSMNRANTSNKTKLPKAKVQDQTASQVTSTKHLKMS